jgi:hypothetical protein
MLMDFRQILNQGHKIKKVIHVGAHYREEVPFYKEQGYAFHRSTGDWK